MKAMLVADWQQAYRWFSMWGLTAIAAAPHVLNAIAGVMPTLQAAGIQTPPAVSWIITGLAVLAAAGRLINQTPTTSAPAQAPTQ